MSDYITTYGGTHFVPTDPCMDHIHITDIAHALSLLCRGNGHVQTFFSVGQHCIRCAKEAKARGYSRRLVLACLLHDASEAYMADITRPFKKHLADYQAYEDRLLEVIYEKYLGSPLTEEEQAMVKKVDDDLLYFDLKVLLREPQKQDPPQMKTDFTYEFVPFEQVEKAYLDWFIMLQKD